MIWLLLLIPVAAVFSAIWLGLIPPPGSAVLIRVANSSLDVRRGAVRSHARESASEILRDAGVADGFIAISHRNKVFFSRQIPAATHQRLRNVLLNQ